MSPSANYLQRVDNFRLQADRLQTRESRLSIFRLITFLSGLILFFILVSISVTPAVLALLACLSVFGGLVKYHAQTEKQKDFFRHLEMINKREHQCLNGNFSEFADGSVYMNRDHPNSYDLDLFGHASVFQYINRTTSKPASDMLAEWLMKPADMAEVLLRQQAVEELRPMIEWRQKLITLGYSNQHAGNDPQTLVAWAGGDNFFARPKRMLMIIYGLSTLGLFSTLLVILGLPAAVLVPILAINFLFYFMHGRSINLLHQQVGKSAEMLQTYSSAISLIEQENFHGDLLSTLQSAFTKGVPVSKEIRRLSKLVGRLDVRLNVMVSVPLNLFFFWDLHCCLALEKWKKDHERDLTRWFSAMAEFEVLSGFANMAYNNPTWAVPKVVPEYFMLRAMDAGHPLIPEQRRICNSLEINQQGKTVLVTGSNMSGKSTFLRTCGVNAVLALAGAPVCASSFTISHVQVFSSMRISDSLEDNTSSFYAELKRLAAIIKESERNPRVFLLLDEILRGTNSNDRYTGSVALIKQLISYNTVAIVATHDLKLAELAQELQGRIDNYHFDVKIDGEELYFDYTLTPGICTSLNASILMRKMGIRIGPEDE